MLRSLWPEIVSLNAFSHDRAGQVDDFSGHEKLAEVDRLIGYAHERSPQIATTRIRDQQISE